MAREQRFWVVMERRDPAAIATAQYFALTEERRSDKLDVQIICGYPKYFLRNVLIFRVLRPYMIKGFVIQRQLNILASRAAMFWAPWRLIRGGDKVLVVATSTIIPLTTAFSSLIKGASYILFIRELYPDQIVAREKLKPSALRVQLMHFANAWLFKHAAKIVVVDREKAELLQARTRGLDIPISTIPDCIA